MGATDLLHRCSPQIVAQPLLVGVVVIRFCAIWAADLLILLIVHVVLVLSIVWLGVDIAVLASSRGWQGLLGRRLPAHGRHHMGATIGAASTTWLAVVGRGWRLQNLGRPISTGVGSDGRTGVRVAHSRLVRLRSQ
jgi:hypothetical protein